MRWTRRRRFVRVLALVVLLGAILPNVTYLGHWTVRGLSQATAQANDDGHANHCHGSSSCADQAAYGLQWWAEGDGPLTLDGDEEPSQTTDGRLSPREPLVVPPDPPPQYA